MNPEEKIETLNKMKDTLMERGWTQTSLENAEGRVCLLGARNIATGRSNELASVEEMQAGLVTNDPYESDEISDILVSIIVPQYRLYTSSLARTGYVYAYNDQIATSINDVLGLLDEAIIKTKEEM